MSKGNLLVRDTCTSLEIRLLLRPGFVWLGRPNDRNPTQDRGKVRMDMNRGRAAHSAPQVASEFWTPLKSVSPMQEEATTYSFTAFDFSVLASSGRPGTGFALGRPTGQTERLNSVMQQLHAETTRNLQSRRKVGILRGESRDGSAL